MKDKIKHLLQALQYNDSIPSLLGKASLVDTYSIKPTITKVRRCNVADGLEISVTFTLHYPDDLQLVRNIQAVSMAYLFSHGTMTLSELREPQVCVFQQRVGFFNRPFVSLPSERLLSVLDASLSHLANNMHQIELFEDLIFPDQYLGNITKLSVLSQLQSSLCSLNKMETKVSQKAQLATVPGSKVFAYLHDYDEEHLCIRIEEAVEDHDGIVDFPFIVIAIKNDGSYYEAYKNCRTLYGERKHHIHDYKFINDHYFCVAARPENHKVDFNMTSIQLGFKRTYQLNEASKFFASNSTYVCGSLLKPETIKQLLTDSISAL